MFEILLSGIILGGLIAAPVGPIGILCIKNTLEYGKISGFFTGLGASFADATYGIIAMIGLGIISQFLLEYKIIIQMLGIGFLLYISINIIRSKEKGNKIKLTHSSLFKDFSTTYFLTLGNPLTILSFIGIFSGIGTLGENMYNQYILVLGVGIGSLIWWITLVNIVSIGEKNISNSHKQKITQFSGIFLLFYALYLLAKLFLFHLYNF